MSRFTTTKFFIGAMIVLTGAALMLSGCSQNPLSYDKTSTQPQVLKRSVDPSAAYSLTGEFHTDSLISASEGGRLVLLDVVLDIPPGAVDRDTIFSIDIPDIEVFYNEFGTDGLVFNVPVTVTMSYRSADLSNVDESTIRIGWLNEKTGVWEDMVCEVDRVNKTVTGQLHHFSAYGLISD